VAIVGCGGVGSWVAQFLALAGCPEIWIFDGDILEIHNLNRIPLPKSAVGQSKAAAMAEAIRTLRPDCSVISGGRFGPKLAEQLWGSAVPQWIICTTDTHHSREMVYKWAGDHGVNYIEAAAEGDQGSTTGEPADFATVDETNPGYASVPVWVGPAVMSASIAVAHVLRNHPMGERVIRLGFRKSSEMEFQVYDSNMEVVHEIN
jgi:hypothetical protein